MRSLNDIMRRAADVTAVSLSELRGRTRRRDVARARIVATFAAYLEQHSIESIGRYLGNRSADDVAYLIRKGKQLQHTEEAFGIQLRQIARGARARRHPRRSDNERIRLTRRWLDIVATGVPKTQAAAEVGVCVQTLWTWARRFELEVDNETDPGEDHRRYERLIMGYNSKVARPNEGPAERSLSTRLSHVV